jgi:hypothetical protein
MTRDDQDDDMHQGGPWLTRRSLLSVLCAVPLATCVTFGQQTPYPTCGRGREPDDCAQFQKFRVERYNRNYN